MQELGGTIVCYLPEPLWPQDLKKFQGWHIGDELIDDFLDHPVLIVPVKQNGKMHEVVEVRQYRP